MPRPRQDPAISAAKRAATYKRYCQRYPDRRREVQRKWREKNRVASKLGKFNIMLRTKYGIDAEDWARMFNAQNCSCAICGDRLDGGLGTHVDHDHATGAIRGLLCHGCNTSIGHLSESPDVLRRAITYLESHGASANAT